MAELQRMSNEELKKLLAQKMDEVYRIRMEIARRSGDTPRPASVDFEQYITK